MPDVLCHQVDKVSFQIQANVPLGRAESPIILIKLLAFVKRPFSAPLTNKRVPISLMVFIQGTTLMEYQRRNGWFGIILFDFLQGFLRICMLSSRWWEGWGDAHREKLSRQDMSFGSGRGVMWREIDSLLLWRRSQNMQALHLQVYIYDLRNQWTQPQPPHFASSFGLLD